MLKLFKALKRKLAAFFNRKTLQDKVDILEKRVAKLEKQNKMLMNAQKKLAEAINVSSTNATKGKKSESNKTTQKADNNQQAVDEMLTKVMAITGWDYATANAKFRDARKRTGNFAFAVA